MAIRGDDDYLGPGDDRSMLIARARSWADAIVANDTERIASFIPRTGSSSPGRASHVERSSSPPCGPAH